MKKNIFIEKPICQTLDQLKIIKCCKKNKDIKNFYKYGFEKSP